MHVNRCSDLLVSGSRRKLGAISDGQRVEVGPDEEGGQAAGGGQVQGAPSSCRCCRRSWEGGAGPGARYSPGGVRYSPGWVGYSPDCIGYSPDTFDVGLSLSGIHLAWSGFHLTVSGFQLTRVTKRLLSDLGSVLVVVSFLVVLVAQVRAWERLRPRARGSRPSRRRCRSTRPW